MTRKLMEDHEKNSKYGTHRGYGTRYDIAGGNGVEIERARAPGLGVFLDYKNKVCAKCKNSKPVKGGTNKNYIFVCADCSTRKKTLQPKENQ